MFFAATGLEVYSFLLTEHCAVLEPQSPWIHKFYVIKKMLLDGFWSSEIVKCSVGLALLCEEILHIFLSRMLAVLSLALPLRPRPSLS